MNTIRRLVPFMAVLLIAALPILFGFGKPSPTSAFELGGLGKKSGGTYLAVENDGATILQINQDGNLSLITSTQFGGGVLNDPFSNTLGSWKRSGIRELTATTVDITFENEDGDFVGVAAATYIIKFDKWFQSARVTCEGAIFAPGVNPFSPEAEPISDSEFTCGEEGLLFHRLPHQNLGLQLSMGQVSDPKPCVVRFLDLNGLPPLQPIPRSEAGFLNGQKGGFPEIKRLTMGAIKGR